MSCLRTPLTQVPAGEWYCELCQERQAAGGDLKAARRILPDDSIRWRQRVRGYAAALS